MINISRPFIKQLSFLTAVTKVTGLGEEISRLIKERLQKMVTGWFVGDHLFKNF